MVLIQPAVLEETVREDCLAASLGNRWRISGNEHGTVTQR